VHPPCYKVWDRLWYCGSPGGQFRNIYRFGEVEDCQPYWDDWMKCMKAKVYQDKNGKKVNIYIIEFIILYLLTILQKLLDSLSVVTADNIPNDIIPPKNVTSWDQSFGSK